MSRCQGEGRRSSSTDLLDGLRRGGGVARGVAMTLAKQESHMAHDAVAHWAEAGEPDEKPLLEDRRHRVVEIAGLGESPQLLDQLGRGRRRTEEVREDAETTGNFGFEIAARRRAVVHL